MSDKDKLRDHGVEKGKPKPGGENESGPPPPPPSPPPPR